MWGGGDRSGVVAHGLIRDSIKYIRRDDIPINGVELVCIEVQPVKASPFLVIAWYRPPSEPVASFEKSEQVLQYLENEDKEIILLGDINHDLLRKENPIHNRPDPLLLMETREQHVVKIARLIKF